MPNVLFVLFFLFFSGIACADFSGKVVHIADGDTITVLTSTKEQVKIRLNGIDCPENKQAYGNKATAFTKDLVALQMVTIQSFGKDRHGRTIAEVILEDGQNLNQELVKAGYALWYRKYAPGNTVLEQLEAKAREAKVGLWKDPHPVPPWVFRHSQSSPIIQPQQPSSNLIPRSDSFNSLPIRGNRRSQKYHRPDCPSYNQISPHNRIPFDSAQAAEDSGYALAGNCPR